MELQVRNLQGEQVEAIQVDEALFGIAPNKHVIHQVMLAQQANQRSGNADTKTRGEVRGSTKKIRAQKYTGRARQGSIRAPHHKGGGVIFGPHPRSFEQQVPKMMRRLAIRSALSAKAAGGELAVLNDFNLDNPRTKDILALFKSLEVAGSVLIATAEPDRSALLSVRNIPKTKVIPVHYLNLLDMVNHHYLIMTVAAVRKAEALWGGERAVLRRAPVPQEVAS